MIRDYILNFFSQIHETLSRKKYRILQSLILLLRFGQVAAVGIICLIYFYFVYVTKTHYCAYYPHDYSCRYPEDKARVPVSYPLILTAALASGIQLILFAFLRLDKSTISISEPSQPAFPKPNGHYYGAFVSRSDILILILYTVAFVFLSDYVVPTRILLGARPGTGCWLYNRYDRYASVVFQECVLGQHGYWWSMGAMLSYLITSIISIGGATRGQREHSVGKGWSGLRPISNRSI
ncbi:uncharacterized protein DFL_005549 [Arthrobotrys flagrans]|uniref:Uncharacterized protein n=1 Tax=Arthrobotrys flagrans TaxID=97331 RepID=A0A436ZXT6_ARTFL|nr:hypothetical protein DFL_005549 [Arthrobotrys flagrans]